jgi:hypothetical protein
MLIFADSPLGGPDIGNVWDDSDNSEIKHNKENAQTKIPVDKFKQLHDPTSNTWANSAEDVQDAVREEEENDLDPTNYYPIDLDSDDSGPEINDVGEECDDFDNEIDDESGNFQFHDDPQNFNDEWDKFFKDHFDYRHVIKPEINEWWNQEVFPGITMLWICLYLFSIKIKHRISESAINSILLLLSMFCDVPKTYKTILKHLKDFGVHSYDLRACAVCKRYVWPGAVDDSIPCPICGDTAKDITVFTPYSSFLALQFAGSSITLIWLILPRLSFFVKQQTR